MKGLLLDVVFYLCGLHCSHMFWLGLFSICVVANCLVSYLILFQDSSVMFVVTRWRVFVLLYLLILWGYITWMHVQLVCLLTLWSWFHLLWKYHWIRSQDSISFANDKFSGIVIILRELMLGHKIFSLKLAKNIHHFHCVLHIVLLVVSNMLGMLDISWIDYECVFWN